MTPLLLAFLANQLVSNGFINLLDILNLPRRRMTQCGGWVVHYARFDNLLMLV